jgi:glycosyltransferase involved in cell wall biosynthesis
MPSDPLVSVIIPAYNAEKTIRNAIDSVLRQTISDLEVIVVDDASTDGTAPAVEAIPDRRVRLLKSACNLRQAAARNLGLRHARGKWVAFLDADDEWVPDRLEYLLAEAGDEADCFIVDLSAKSVEGPGGRLSPIAQTAHLRERLTENFGFEEYLNLRMDVKPIVTRDAFTRHQIQFPEWGSCGDWAFLIARLSASGSRGKLVHRVGYLYRVTGFHDSSTLRGIEEQLKVQEHLAADPDIPQAARDLLKQGAPGIRKRLVVAALREGKWRKLAHYVRQNPADLLILPGSVLRFLWRRIRYEIAS